MAYDPYRTQRRARTAQKQPQADAVVVALTAQVLVCILLLLVAVLAKNTNESRYRVVKEEYEVLVTQEGGFDGLGDLGGTLQRLFLSLEEAITSFVNRFSGGETPPVAEVVPEDPGLADGQNPPAGGVVPEAPDLTEPSEDADLTGGANPAGDAAPGSAADGGDAGAALTPAVPGFDYNYLAGEDLAMASFALPGGMPAGGTAPVGGALRAAPEGNTYAPVALMGKVKAPVTGLITSEFAYRDHPLSGKEDFHNGIDIAAEQGRDILAALPGRVAEVGESDIYGHYIVVRHTDNFETFYAHCSEILAAEGMQVRQGERIAQVGSTGVATGPHLHFSVLVDGQYTDPCWLLQDNIKLVG